LIIMKPLTVLRAATRLLFSGLLAATLPAADLRLGMIGLDTGHVIEFTKILHRGFGTSADGTTALYNKYGKVNVKTWPNKSVKIEVTNVVNAKKKRETAEAFKKLNGSICGNRWFAVLSAR